MSLLDVTADAGGWEGYRIAETRSLESGGIRRIEIELTPERSNGLICDGCGQHVDAVPETMRRTIRDLPILDAQALLIVPRRRLLCPRCGHALSVCPGSSDMRVSPKG